MIVIITARLNYSECESGGEFDVVHCADYDERDVQMRLYGFEDEITAKLQADY